MLAEYLGGASLTEEFLDRWRTPGDVALQAVGGALRRDAVRAPRASRPGSRPWSAAGLAPADVAQVVVAGTHARAVPPGVDQDQRRHRRAAEDLLATVGNPARPSRACCWPTRWSGPRPARSSPWWCWPTAPTWPLFRATDALDAHVPARPGRRPGRRGARRPAPTSRSWPGTAWSPSSRPVAPNRPGSSSSAAARNDEWKFGFVGQPGPVHRRGAPAAGRVSYQGGAVDDMEPLPMADATGTIVTFTVDRLAYSPSPPIVFAVVDFDEAAGGGRLPMELTDVRRRRRGHRRPGRDDLPPHQPGRRHPELLLEGQADQGGSHELARHPATRSPSSGWAAPRSASTGTRAPTTS